MYTTASADVSFHDKLCAILVTKKRSVIRTVNRSCDLHLVSCVWYGVVNRTCITTETNDNHGVSRNTTWIRDRVKNYPSAVKLSSRLENRDRFENEKSAERGRQRERDLTLSCDIYSYGEFFATFLNDLWSVLLSSTRPWQNRITSRRKISTYEQHKYFHI